ncbi:MAG: glycerol kinase GlpK [Puniceicoccaceae bacterium]
MAKDYLLALDQGTTSSRAILFDRKGSIRAVAQREFPQYFPHPAWVEHDPSEIWSSQSAVLAEVLAKADVSARRVDSIGITNQRETVLVWDRETGRPVHPAIVWQDRRTAGRTGLLQSGGHAEMIRRKTGLLPDPYFSGSKVRWILDNVGGVRERAEAGELALGTIDSWLVWKLTEGAVHVTDATNACRTMLMNIHTGDWDDELLALLEIPRSLLPEIRGCSEVYGECALSAAAGVPIAGMAGDQHAALFGQACFGKGMTKNTYGTGSFLLMNTGREAVVSKNHLLTTIAWRIGDETEYALEGSIFISGAVVQWLRDGMGLFRTAPMIEALAESVPDSDGVFFVPAFAGLGAPYWDPHARGLIVGLTRGSTDAHIARAALEAIAFQSCDVLEAMARDSGMTLKELRVDGGASKNDLLMQIQADILQGRVVRPRMTETTALGAACLAGLATGYYQDREEVAAQWTEDRVFEPTRKPAEIDEVRKKWKRAVRLSRQWHEEAGG